VQQGGGRLLALVLTFVIFGLASGALTALVGLGVVVVYRSSGVVNFSASAMAAIAAYICYWLRDQPGVPPVVALLVGLVAGGVLGLITHLAMAALRVASQLAKLVVTLALFTSAQALILIIWGAGTTIPQSFFPTSSIQLPGAVTIPEDRITLAVLALVLAVGLAVVYRRTMFGLATSAIAENRVFAASSGWAPGRNEVINQIVAGILSAGAAIFLAPIVGLNGAILSIVILPALAAALVGRFSSFTLTVAAALVIGIAESVLGLYEADIARWMHVSALSLSSLPEAVPLLIIICLTIAAGRSRLQRGESQALLPLPGDGRVSSVPLGFGLLGAIAILLFAPSWGDAMVAFAAWGMLLISVVLLTGYAGQLSLCQFALAGFGGWVAARVSAAAGLPFLLALIIGAVSAALTGLIVAIPALRTRGVNLAIATLALALLLNALVFTNTSLTGGYNGIPVRSPHVFGIDLDPIAYPTRYAAFGFILLVICGLLVANLRRGPTGRRLLAIRSDERAASALGVGVYGAKLFAFATASGIAGLAGTYLTFQFPFAQFSNFDVTTSLQLVQNAVLGGLGWISGVPVGASAMSGSVLSHASNLELVTVQNINSWLALLTSLLLILVLRQSPDGVASVWSRVFNSPRSEALRAKLRLPVPLWRAWGFTEVGTGIALLLGVVIHDLALAGAVATILIFVTQAALRLRTGSGVRELGREAILIVLAGLLIAFRNVDTTGAAVFAFAGNQIVGLPVLTAGLSKLSGRIVARGRLPRLRLQHRPDADEAVKALSLQLDGVTVRFGGVTALDGVTFGVEPGEIVGLIGPNGAGKTTLLDVATGFTRPLSGRVQADGHVDISDWPAARRSRHGLVRSWQGVDLFDSMTVRENLLVAAERNSRHRYLLDFIRPGNQRVAASMEQVIAQFGLSGYLDQRASGLPQGIRRLIGIARAAAAAPRMLLLDEPAAGLDHHESAQLASTIRQVRDHYGIGILVVEHDVPMLMGLCDRLVVLDFGRVIAQGSPAEVQANPLVIEAYLGDVAVAADPSERH
jgi:ABC-type branched-subunit amino acid transport system ATPase component/ABC-type branched-subunit amino acid transport system permease subunit